MSHVAYNQLWYEAQSSIRTIIKDDFPPIPPVPIKDKSVVFQKLATLFIKYVQVFRKLEICYDQIVHPQKRMVLKQVLEGTIGRLLEVKDELVRLEFSEYHFFDDVLTDLKLTPADMEIPVPKYFVNNQKAVLKERMHILSNIIEKCQTGDTSGKPKPMTVEEAVRLIQINERARQGRLRAKFMIDIRIDEARKKLLLERGAPTVDEGTAATRIQKTWRGYVQRKTTKLLRNSEMVFIGMSTNNNEVQRVNPYVPALKVEENRRTIQDDNEIDYKQALITIKEQVLENQGPDIKEMLMNQLRQWFIECRELTGSLPDYPDEGSEGLFTKKTPKQVEEEMRLAELGETPNKPDTQEEPPPLNEEDPGWTMKESKFVGAIKEGDAEYTQLWKNKDESNNFAQKYDASLIKEQKFVEVEAEIRVQVDVLMREELNNLRLAIDNQKSKKAKKKKEKKPKGKKKGKDLTEGRTVESLYEELIQQGVLIKSQNITMDDYFGDFNYLATSLRQHDFEPQPSLSDVRQLVTLYGILPMGSAHVHENIPLIKSILLAGPRGVGKKSLVHVIANAVGANLFDLSAGNIVGKYPGKPGLTLLLNAVMRVATELQPSVIYIGECEKAFAKKVPKEDTTDPKRLKSDLPKLLKLFNVNDRILLVGTSHAPFSAAVKPFCKVYQKVIMIPRPDYSSRLLLWSKLIPKYGGVITPMLDMSSLAKVTDGFTQGHIVDAIKTTLTEKRISKLDEKPLLAIEFLAPLAKLEPVWEDEEQEYTDWFKKTPLGAVREKMLKAAQKALAENG